jgi:hypothetical protein
VAEAAVEDVATSWVGGLVVVVGVGLVGFGEAVGLVEPWRTGAGWPPATVVTLVLVVA